MVAREQYDVAILGGGLAGLTLARQLRMRLPEIRVAVIEKREFPVAETTHKVGESTVEIGAHYFGEQLRLKKHLTDHQLPKFGLRFFFKDAHQTLAEGTEVGGSDFFLVVMTLQKGKAPKVTATVKGMTANVTVGSQTVTFDGERLLLRR